MIVVEFQRTKLHAIYFVLWQQVLQVCPGMLYFVLCALLSQNSQDGHALFWECIFGGAQTRYAMKSLGGNCRI